MYRKDPALLFSTRSLHEIAESVSLRSTYKHAVVLTKIQYKILLEKCIFKWVAIRNSAMDLLK